ncbi:calcium-independent phospholipase A2-gamma-like isoform X2 [Chelonus insularis]|nr:calcium-independent phospholipase A2-gamma-like isoform X2 [Chelonus insularis]
MAEKISNSMNTLSKSKVIMQNHWKSFAFLKTFLNKYEYANKHLQWNVYKYWISVTQQLANSTLGNKRSLSVIGRTTNKNNKTIDDQKSNENSETLKEKSNVSVVKVQLPKEVIERSSTYKVPDNNNTQINSNIHKEEPSVTAATTSDQVIQSTKDQILALPQVLSDFFVKFNPIIKDSPPLMTVPKWKKCATNNVTKNSIIARTKHVLNSITTAESNASQLRRVDDLLTHLEQYPEARYHAIKEGAVKTLLRVREKSKDENVKASIREALAVVGYADPVPRRGIRILAIDGGGIRGLVAIEMLKKLEKLTGQRVHEMFDYMCGVSTGAILLANLGSSRRKSLDEISDLYKALSNKIFNQSAILGTSTLMWSHAYYDTTLWEKMLIEQLGDEELIRTNRDPTSPKFSAIATVSNNTQVMAYIFRNYTLPPKVQSHYIGSHRHKLWESVRASAAAPTYFEEFKHGNYMLSDGGILVNNPCGVAIHEAKRIWPNTPIQCVVSFGTGRIPPNSPHNEEQTGTTGTSSWKEKFYKILASATDTEGVHTMLNELLPDHVYYRFNPYLTEMVDMDELRPEKISLLEQDAQMYIRRNEDKFIQAVEALKQTKPISQKALDWIKLQKELLGL